MISPTERKTIEETAREFGVGRLWLFGSSLDETREAYDIDLAVEGIEPRLFFEFYGKLIRRLSRPVDLVDLSKPVAIAQIIRKTGVCIYG